MPLFSCGINHHLTPIAIREKVSFDSAQTAVALDNLRYSKAVNEAVLLSTCNRTEVYFSSDGPEPIYEWLADYSTTQNIELKKYYYTYQDMATVRHLLRVSSGLDSMILGEPQILGQIKQAYRTACEVGTVGQQLGHLFPAIFAASKQIRQQAQLTAQPISLAYATTQLAKRIFSSLQNCQILLIGAGEIIELMITHLQSHGVNQLVVANRTLTKAQQLAKLSRGHAIHIADVPAYLPQMDIVITAISSQLPVIGKGLVEKTLKMKKRRPILMIDLAVPRNIEPEIAQLSDIYLYNIDDLKVIIDTNMKNRREAAKQAEALVELQATHYMQKLHILNISDIIKQVRQQAEQHRDQTVQKALIELRQGRDPSLVINHLARHLTNKILHHPTVKLREAAYHQRIDMVMLAKELLTLSE